MPERVGGAARARTYGVAKNAAKHRGVQGGTPPLRAIYFPCSVHVYCMSCETVVFHRAPSNGDPICRQVAGGIFHFFSETPGRFCRVIRFLEGPYSVARGPNRVGVAGSAVTGIGVAGIGVAGIGAFELHLFLLTHLGAWR